MVGKLRVAVLGEKPQGAEWLKILLESELFEVVCGVPRHLKGPVWWGADDFAILLEEYRIPIIQREELDRYSYDILWSLMYGFIIEEKWIRKAKFGVNLHESPLPRYRGCNGCSHAILNGDSTYGTTLHLLDPELDRGAIIDQEIFPIYSAETAKELYNRTRMISTDLFERNLKAISTGKFETREIDVSGEAVRARSSLIEEKSGDLGISFEDLVKKARALDFTPFEPFHIETDFGKYFCFVNGSDGREDHLDEALEIKWPKVEKVPVMVCPFEDREVILMEENRYSQYYPIFYSAAERSRSHQ